MVLLTLLVLRVLLSLSVGEIFCRLMVFYHVYEFLSLPEQYVCFANSGILTAIFILFYFVISKRVINKALLKIGEIEVIFSRFTLKELVAFVVSAVIGLIFAYCLGIVLSQFSFFGPLAYMFLNITMAYLACVLFGHKINEVGFGKERYFATGGSKAEKVPVLRPKILDTSVIIDGRILDILRTGFIEGRILIPNFVLDELRHIADSADPLKRNRGRRGLDILNEIQKQSVTMVKIADWSGDDNSEVDVKLIKMAEKYNAYVVTNDFNLNKVAEFTGVSVLNINELSNAVKPIVLPGEDLCVEIVKDGKGNGQGIGYLNDGTMIVIEGGYKHIGETLDVLVTSILQTAAGRMIFTRIKSEA